MKDIVLYVNNNTFLSEIKENVKKIILFIRERSSVLSGNKLRNKASLFTIFTMMLRVRKEF